MLFKLKYIRNYFLSHVYRFEYMANAKKCPCEISTACNQQSCECLEYCTKYIVPRTEQLASYKYFTISPSPSHYTNVRAVVHDWIEKFNKLSRQLSDWISVFEFAGSRIHIHGIALPKEGREYGLINTFFKWSHFHNVRLHSKFTHGTHYLFKEASYTESLIGHAHILAPELMSSIMILIQKKPETPIARAIIDFESKNKSNKKPVLNQLMVELDSVIDDV